MDPRLIVPDPGPRPKFSDSNYTLLSITCALVRKLKCTFHQDLMNVTILLNVNYVKSLLDEFNLARNLVALRSVNIRKYHFSGNYWSKFVYNKLPTWVVIALVI